MSQLPNFTFLDFQNFNSLSFQLSEQIKHSSEKFDWIVEISRGGACVARLLSDFMELPILTVGIRSYHGVGEQGELEIFQPLSVSIAEQSILLVDEVSDSGATFKAAVEHLQALNPANLKTASIHIKPHSQYKPDFYATETSDWIIYPYEAVETVKELGKHFSENPDLKQHFLNYFSRLGFSQEQITAILS